MGVAEGRIVFIGKVRTGSETTIDAEGLVVAPGFIDPHRNSDLMLMAEPEDMPRVMQGITTEVVGQDGLGEAVRKMTYLPRALASTTGGCLGPGCGRI